MPTAAVMETERLLKAKNAGGYGVPFKYKKANHPFDLLLPHEAVVELSNVSGLYVYKNDFVEWLGPATGVSTTTNGWVSTAVEGGAGASALELSSTLPGGVLSLTSDAGSGDLINLQRTVEDFKFVLGKRAGFFARIAPGAAITTVDYLFGLVITDTSLIASAPTDGLFFTKLAAASVFTFSARKDGTSTTVTPVNPSTIVASTFSYYGFMISPSGQINVYFGLSWNSMVQVGQITALNANIPDDEELALSFSLRNTAAAARSMLIDNVMYFREM